MIQVRRLQVIQVHPLGVVILTVGHSSTVWCVNLYGALNHCARGETLADTGTPTLLPHGKSTPNILSINVLSTAQPRVMQGVGVDFMDVTMGDIYGVGGGVVIPSCLKSPVLVYLSQSCYIV